MGLSNTPTGLSALDKVTPVKTRDAMHRKANLNNTLTILIAFALVERSESDDMSPSSSRSSKRSFDRNVDYLDLLRIHSVVQAFFTDSLHEQRQIPFWLERAMAVWYRSYDEADRRIREDPRVGLPDDYRRFCIHGQKLLQNLGRFERRYPSLAKFRPQLEQRLEKIQGQIDHLSHAIQTNTTDGSAAGHATSIFDRASTSSQSDAATMQSHSSETSGMGSLGDGESEMVQSPVVELLELDVPYPSTPVMPTAPEIIEDDDQETVILSVAGTQVHVGATELAEVVSLPPDPSDHHQETAAFDDWHEAIPHHRVITRQETRRYHDRAGAWRDNTISDPRVGLSREMAVGSVFSKRETSRSPLGARLTARSDAEMELNKIKLATPPPKEPTASFGYQMPTRPSLLGINSWALPRRAKALDSEAAQPPAEVLSGGLAQILSSSKTWTQATLEVLKRTVLGSDKHAEEPAQFGLPPESHFTPPAPIFRGSRSANSSPASNLSPFPPPSFSGIPTEDLLAKPGLPLAIHRWDTVDQPNGTLVNSSGMEWASDPDPLSLSYPPLPPSRQQRPSNIHPAPIILHSGLPTGYSSQPMSRDGSHQSNPSIVQSPPSRSPSPPHSNPLSVYHKSSPMPAGPATTTKALLIPAAQTRLSPFARARPPSYTETEPSPRLDTPFSDVDTSYHRWEQHHGLAPPTTTLGASFPPAAASSSSGGIGNSAGKQPLTRWRRGRGTGRGREERRAHSLSPPPPLPPSLHTGERDGDGVGRSGSPSRGRPQTQPQHHQQHLHHYGVHHLNQHQQPHHQQLHHQHHQHQHLQHQLQHHPNHHQHNQHPPTTTNDKTGGEPMARSGSADSRSSGGGGIGGIKIDDQTVVEFGSPGLGSSSGSGGGLKSGDDTGAGTGGGGGKSRIRKGSLPFSFDGLGILE